MVPEKNIINALDPSFEISLRSILRVRRTSEQGSKYLDATKYSCEFDGSINLK
tara:strand:- start:257 stop:415 length:159 start_codon:yes stop_codon:yes gene_type:complete